MNAEPSSHPASKGPVVGVFDSGAGGLSVLNALMTHLPQARFIYAADSGHAPYGERDDAWLQERCTVLASFLRERGAELVVMACNTATAAAAPLLRAQHPEWSIVGMEPGVKPAVQQSRRKRVGVMATRATLQSVRYARLVSEHGHDAVVVAQPCTGLAWAIERGNTAEMAQLVAQHTEPLRRAEVDTVVLGCTHYPFARSWIEQAMGPGVDVIDTAQAVARRAASLVARRGGTRHRWPPTDRFSSAPSQAPTLANLEFWTTGDPAALDRFAERWLGWQIRTSDLQGEATAPGPAAPTR